jgi:Subtilase family
MTSCSISGTVLTAMFTTLVMACGFCASVVRSAESIVQGVVVNAPARIDQAANIAAGSDNSAAQAAVVMKNVKIGGTVANSGQSQGTVNMAVGKKNVANQGSVMISRTMVEGTVVNKAVNKASSNIAAGSENKADQASVRIESGKIRGAVMNTSTQQKSTNLAAGTQNTASQNSIVMEGSQVRGAVTNSATAENSANLAIGHRNQASQSSIVVDGGGGAASVMSGLRNSEGDDRGQGDDAVVAYLKTKEGQQEIDATAAPHVPGQVVFLVDNDQAGLATLDRVAQTWRLAVEEKNALDSLNRLMVVASSRRDTREIAKALQKEAGIYNPQPNYVFTTMGQEDPLSSMQNLVSLLDLQEIHSKASGKGITVAVVDTGVEIDHEDLRPRLVGHHNFISGSVYRGEIHGTAVAGIIAAGRNQSGIVGIAPQVSLLALRACRQTGKNSAVGECFSTSLVRSLDAAILAKVQVVNLSLGAYINDSLLGMMIDNGHGKGIVFAAPVGNDPSVETMAFPASHKKVVSVAGLDEKGNPLPNKKLATMADAVAPATHLFVTAPGNGYNFIDGTSLASGSISGIIALSMERKVKNRECWPRYGVGQPWARQVHQCLGL